MKEPYGEGGASHTGPESCAGTREGAGEALTGARAGWVLSHEIPETLRGADAVHGSGRPRRQHRQRQRLTDPARSETPCTLGNSTRRNWETPRSTAEGAAVRAVNPQGARRR